MEIEIKKELERIKLLNDFDAREQLRGFGFWLCPFVKQFYKVEDPKYKKTYKFMFKELEKKYNKANEGIKVFNCKMELQNKKGLIFHHEENFEERNEEEVLKRVKEKVFRNYNTRNNAIINNPIFNKIEIKLKE